MPYIVICIVYLKAHTFRILVDILRLNICTKLLISIQATLGFTKKNEPTISKALKKIEDQYGLLATCRNDSILYKVEM